MRAARLTDIMHGTSVPGIPAKPQAASADEVRIRALSQRRRDAPIPLDRGCSPRAIAKKSWPPEFVPPESWHHAQRRSPYDGARNRLFEWHVRFVVREKNPSPPHSAPEASATSRSHRAACRSIRLVESIRLPLPSAHAPNPRPHPTCPP